jgi:hypothetical protein
MRSNLHVTAGTKYFRLALCACLLPIALAHAAGKRVHLAPNFSPGESLRYRIESRTTTTGKTTTPIVNPEGGSQSLQLVHLVVRLDVLDAQPPATTGPASVRLRATYEKSSAEEQTDAYNPAAPPFADQYSRIEGRSVEFTIDATGKTSAFKGLEDIFPDRSAAQPLVSWIDALSSGDGFPSPGVAIAEKWKNERPLTGAPLVGLEWHAESTYLRNEPCSSHSVEDIPANQPQIDPGSCAVILTRFEISRRGSATKDATPEDFLRNGLRTSGTWTGSGESLNSISLPSGLLRSSTQTSNQTMDYLITSATTGSSIHRVGKVQSQSDITLLPNLP